MSRRAALITLALLALVPLGCKHDRSQAVAASYSSVTRPAPVVAAPLSAVGAASIPVEEEYEERAVSAITQANLATQIAEIEKEIR